MQWQVWSWFARLRYKQPKGSFEYSADIESLNFQAIVRPLTGVKLPVRRMMLNRPEIALTGHSRSWILASDFGCFRPGADAQGSVQRSVIEDQPEDRVADRGVQFAEFRMCRSSCTSDQASAFED